MAPVNPNTTTQTARLPPMELAISGMTCGNCARHVAEAIQGVTGVSRASVQLDAGRATVRWQTPPNLKGVVEAVREAGYEARLVEEQEPQVAGETAWSPLSGWRFNVVVGLACTLPLIIGEWIFGLGMVPWFHWAAFALALPVQMFCGARFYAGAWRQLKVRSSNMDTLVALGSTTAFGYSAWALFTGIPGHLYFMESAAIITLISLGHWFEARTSAQAESSLHALLNLAPLHARRRNPDNTETEVPVRDLQLNDLVVLKPGDRVPTDGEVISGESTLDESMLTGESNPVDKSPGDKLYGGTVNVNGRLCLRVTALGEATALAHIIAAVQRAQTSRAEIQRLGDRVSAVFVPCVVLIAVATGLWWGLAPESAARVSAAFAGYLWPATQAENALAAGLIHAAAVLIIACPCAMGLATPVAIMAGTNAAARRGILIRDGVALERAGRITALVFDKTGTLTQGKPVVVKEEEYELPAAYLHPGICSRRREEADPADPINPSHSGTTPKNPSSPSPLLGERAGERGHPIITPASEHTPIKLAAALARRSSHPNSLAVEQLYSDDFPFTDWQEVRGSGVQARLALDDSTVPLLRLGSLRWLRESGVDVAPSRAFDEHWMSQGATVLGIASDRHLLGTLALEDTLKPGAAEVIAQLQRQGLNLYLVTGDNSLTAQAIAGQVGIPSQNIFAEVRPGQKAEFIRKLQVADGRVAFVGDGINDAPALEAADLGIAVSRASDVAREASDIILLKSEIEAVPEALGLAQATLRTIKQNLFWAFFYNAVGIPLAALGFLSPILCALAMGLSDLVVIGNALRLLRRRSSGGGTGVPPVDLGVPPKSVERATTGTSGYTESESSDCPPKN